MATVTDARLLLDSLGRAREELDAAALEMALGRLRVMTVDELTVPSQVATEIRDATAEAVTALERLLKAVDRRGRT